MTFGKDGTVKIWKRNVQGLPPKLVTSIKPEMQDAGHICIADYTDDGQLIFIFDNAGDLQYV